MLSRSKGQRTCLKCFGHFLVLFITNLLKRAQNKLTISTTLPFIVTNIVYKRQNNSFIFRRTAPLQRAVLSEIVISFIISCPKFFLFLLNTFVLSEHEARLEGYSFSPRLGFDVTYKYRFAFETAFWQTSKLDPKKMAVSKQFLSNFPRFKISGVPTVNEIKLFTYPLQLHMFQVQKILHHLSLKKQPRICTFGG